MSIWTLNAANTYFTTRLRASKWTAAADAEKTAALTTAEEQLNAVFGALTETAANQKCVYEQALFLLNDSGAEMRAALQGQGVVAAGIVEESYGAGGGGIPVCPYARRVLSGTDALYGDVLTRDDSA